MKKITLGKTKIAAVFCLMILSMQLLAQNYTDRIFCDTAYPANGHRFFKMPDSSIAYCGELYNAPVQSGHIIKLTPDYHFQWGVRYSKGITSNELSFIDMIQLPDSGFIVLCKMADSIASAYIFSTLIFRTDVAGNLMYVKDISDPTVPNNLTPTALVNINDTTFYIAARVWSTIGSAVVIKMHTNGMVLKSKYVRLNAGNHTASSYSITRLLNNSFLLTSGDIGASIAFYCFDDDANLVWNKALNLPSVALIPYKVIATTDSSFLVLGTNAVPNFGPVALKMSQTGDFLWSRSYTSDTINRFDFRAGIEWGNSYFVAGTNGFVLNYIPFVMQLDTLGNILNTETYLHTGQPYSIVDMTRRNNTIELCIASRINPSAVSGMGIATVDSTLYSPCSNNHVTFTDSSLVFSMFSSLHIDSVPVVATDITTQFQATSFTLSETDLCMPTGVAEIYLNQTPVVYPNPVNSVVTVITHALNSHIELYDLTGRNLLTTNVNYKKGIEMQHFPAGIYFIVIRSGEYAKVHKVFKK